MKFNWWPFKKTPKLVQIGSSLMPYSELIKIRNIELTTNSGGWKVCIRAEMWDRTILRNYTFATHEEAVRRQTAITDFLKKEGKM